MKTAITITLLLCGFICKGQVIYFRSDSIGLGFNKIIQFDEYRPDSAMIPVFTGTEWTEKDHIISNQERIIENKDSIIAIQKRYIESLEAERDMWKLLFLIESNPTDEMPLTDDKIKNF